MPKYELLPEWSPQSAILITWPHEYTAWGSDLRAIDNVYVQMASAIVPSQKLLINCFNVTHREHIQTLLKNADIRMENIDFYLIPTNDVWTRDYGPLSVKNLQNNGKLNLLKFQFNGWGNKYAHDKDNLATIYLHQQKAFEALPLSTENFILEGGSLEVDGHGTLLTTESCLLNPSRNPDYTREQIEEILKDRLNVNRILWLKQSYLAGDDTDGHIDMIARFVNPTTIVYTACFDLNDEHYTTCAQIEAELKTFRNFQNEPYTLLPLPIPQAKYDEDGKRLPASYANFLITNECVLLPIYDDPNDYVAISTLSALFKNRKIVPIFANALIQQYGSIHCASMQIAAPLND